MLITDCGGLLCYVISCYNLHNDVCFICTLRVECERGMYDLSAYKMTTFGNHGRVWLTDGNG